MLRADFPFCSPSAARSTSLRRGFHGNPRQSPAAPRYPRHRLRQGKERVRSPPRLPASKTCGKAQGKALESRTVEGKAPGRVLAPCPPGGLHSHHSPGSRHGVCWGSHLRAYPWGSQGSAPAPSGARVATERTNHGSGQPQGSPPETSCQSWQPGGWLSAAPHHVRQQQTPRWHMRRCPQGHAGTRSCQAHRLPQHPAPQHPWERGSPRHAGAKGREQPAQGGGRLGCASSLHTLSCNEERVTHAISSRSWPRSRRQRAERLLGAGEEELQGRISFTCSPGWRGDGHGDSAGTCRWFSAGWGQPVVTATSLPHSQLGCRSCCPAGAGMCPSITEYFITVGCNRKRTQDAGWLLFISGG